MDPKKPQSFQKQLDRHRLMAIIAAWLHKATAWLGRSTLAWATIVLMGGFASNLAISDFRTVTSLVVLLAILLAVSLFACTFVTKKSLSTGSFYPSKIIYQDKRLTTVNLIKSASFLFQCTGFGFCFYVSASKIHTQGWKSISSYVFGKSPAVNDAPTIITCLLSCTNKHDINTAVSALQACVQACFPEQNRSASNLQVSLITFHTLVIITCAFGLLSNLYIFCPIVQAWISGRPKPLSLTRYHDEVLSRAMNIGLANASEFDARVFLLQGVGEYLAVRNIGPLEVKRQNKDFVDYLLHHPKGMEMVLGMLKSEDTLQQQTAVNMAGFWCDQPNMAKVGKELLSGLGEKLGMPGKVAEGAANSFKALAFAWKDKDFSPLLKVSVSRSGVRRGGL